MLFNFDLSNRETLILEICVLSSEADTELPKTIVALKNFVNFSGRGLGESRF